MYIIHLYIYRNMLFIFLIKCFLNDNQIKFHQISNDLVIIVHKFLSKVFYVSFIHHMIFLLIHFINSVLNFTDHLKDYYFSLFNFNFNFILPNHLVVLILVHSLYNNYRYI